MLRLLSCWLLYLLFRGIPKAGTGGNPEAEAGAWAVHVHAGRDHHAVKESTRVRRELFAIMPERAALDLNLSVRCYGCELVAGG